MMKEIWTFLGDELLKLNVNTIYYAELTTFIFLLSWVATKSYYEFYSYDFLPLESVLKSQVFNIYYINIK